MSVKIILRKDKVNKRGEAPLHVRMYVNGSNTERSLNIRVRPEHWDENKEIVKSKHPNSIRFNKTLSKKRTEYLSIYLESIEEGDDLKKEKLDVLKGKPKADFLSYGRDYIESEEGKIKHGYYRRMKSTFNIFENYIPSKSLPFNKVSISLLKDFHSFLQREKGNSPNTIRSKFRILNTIYNSARKEGMISGEVQNPFDIYKVKSEKTTRQYLTKDEVEAIQNLELEGKVELHRDLFVFCCLSGGLRMGDLLSLKKNEIKEYVIKKKTRKSGSAVIIRIPKQLRDFIDFHKKRKGKFVFPLLPNDFDELTEKRQSQIIASLNTQINRDLKTVRELAEIDKPLSFHIGRHTFGTLALQNKMRIEHLKEIMGHANIRETLIYAKIVNEDLINAMKVFDE